MDVYILFTIFLLFGKIFSICPLLRNKTSFAHRGGNIENFPENSLEIFTDSAFRGFSIEMDLMLTGSGEVIAFHDLNTFDKTGIYKDVRISTFDDLKNLTILNDLGGRRYNTSSKIPLLKTVLDIVCKINKNIGIWMDIKYSFDVRYILSILDVMDASPCSCESSQNLIIEVFKDIAALDNLRYYMKERRCKFHTALSFYAFQADLTFSVLKDQLNFYRDYTDVIDFDYLIVKKYPDLLHLNRDNKICNSIYGDEDQELKEIYKNELIDIQIYNSKE